MSNWMSKCWRCNQEFYNQFGNNTLCDKCLGREPKTTNTIYNYVEKFVVQVIDEKEKKCFDAIYQDMQEHPDKYDFDELYLITRERVVELIKLGLQKEKENKNE